MAPFPVDPSGGDGPGCARLCAGGTPALPGSRHPMTSSHQGHQIAEAFRYRLWVKEVHLSSCLFVSIRGSSSLTIGRFSSNDPHGRAGTGWQANGSFPRGAGRLSEKSPARHPPPHRRGGLTWERGRPARILFLITRERGRPARILVPLAGAELQCNAAGSHPVGENPIGQAEGEPWRRSRLIQVGEMAEAVPGLVRAGRPRSREAFIP